MKTKHKYDQERYVCYDNRHCPWPGSLEPVEKCPVCGNCVAIIPAIRTGSMVAFQSGRNMRIRGISKPVTEVHIEAADIPDLADFINLTMLKRENDFKLHSFRESLELLLEQLNSTIFVKETLENIKKDIAADFEAEMVELQEKEMELYDSGNYSGAAYALKIEQSVYKHALSLVHNVIDAQLEEIQSCVM